MFIIRLFAALLPIFSVLGHTIEHRRDNALNQDPEALLNRAISAQGGSQNISAIQSVTYVGNTVLRSNSLLAAISLTDVDVPVLTAGRQNVSFSFDEPHVKQRLDRFAQIGPIFQFGRTSLEPMEYSLVIEGGSQGFASVVKGSYSLYDPNAPPTGYMDGLFAEYAIFEAMKWDPFLLSKILSNGNFTFRQGDVGTGVQIPGVHDEGLGLTVLFDPHTHLPYIIRSYEDHLMYGPSTHDLRVSEYVTVDGVQLPKRFKTLYNGEHIIQDYLADEVLVNPQVPTDFFRALGNGTIPEISIPARDPEYGFAEIGELSAMFIWGKYGGSLDTVIATKPLADVPGLWSWTANNEPTAMRQVIVELEDGSVIVLDCPPHQSKLVIEWTQKTLGKPVTHVWPSHHHHDHAAGVGDFLAIGAKLIAPEYAVNYYAGLNISSEQVVTYRFGEPLVLSDSRTQLALVDMQASYHARDHGYAYIRPACPTATSSTAVFDADHGNLAYIEIFDQATVHEFLNVIATDGVAASAQFLPSHGPAGTLQDVIRPIAYLYPDHSPTDFKFDQSKCS